MKKSLIIIIVTVILIGVISGIFYKINSDYKNELKNIQNQLNQYQTEKEQTNKQIEEQQTQVKNLNKQIEELKLQNFILQENNSVGIVKLTVDGKEVIFEKEDYPLSSFRSEDEFFYARVFSKNKDYNLNLRHNNNKVLGINKLYDYNEKIEIDIKNITPDEYSLELGDCSDDNNDKNSKFEILDYNFNKKTMTVLIYGEFNCNGHQYSINALLKDRIPETLYIGAV